MEKKQEGVRIGGSTKLDELIEAKLQREYFKAVKRINKRKWRVPEILSQLMQVKGKDKRKLEDELTLLMRKAKIDNELVRKFHSIYSENQPVETDTKKRRKKSNQETVTDDLDSSSMNSFQRPMTTATISPTTTGLGRFAKNRSSKTDGNKYKKAASPQTMLSKTFESGYSSLDEYMSGGDPRSVNIKDAARTASDRDLPSLVDQIERERVRPAIEHVNKISDELAVEAPRVQALPEIQVAADFDDDNDDFPRRFERYKTLFSF